MENNMENNVMDKLETVTYPAAVLRRWFTRRWWCFWISPRELTIDNLVEFMLKEWPYATYPITPAAGIIRATLKDTSIMLQQYLVDFHEVRRWKNESGYLAYTSVMCSSLATIGHYGEFNESQNKVFRDKYLDHVFAGLPDETKALLKDDLEAVKKLLDSHDLMSAYLGEKE